VKKRKKSIKDHHFDLGSFVQGLDEENLEKMLQN
jgi:hypothetical protein